MKFLVLGCNGMAGHIISIYLKEKGHDVTGFAREKSPYIPTIVGDATNFVLLKDIIVTQHFDTVINCIGLLNQFAEENHAQAVLLNGYLPHFLAEVTEELPTQIIHMSTDCVFSGKRGGYTEQDFPDGELFYDRSKAIGELVDNKNVTLRNSIIGPDINRQGIGLLNWFMQQDDTVTGFQKAIWTGQTTLQLAKTMEYVAVHHISGLYNAVPNQAINKYELLLLFNKYIRKYPIEIIPQQTFVADKSLIRTRFGEFDYAIPDYEVMVAELGDWMRSHKELYPHYEI
ncbi:SDR family oxidoreductase [Streptococcus sp. S784/96/1]|uniref:SDR family oxidoreductase n=1 Tax=Streptococcus sp. S784/96/1 TaxID=2653499 RepID=UPI001389FE09|nr:sugar nucleotide-binding protein [Streptococcus sp. S784/96/1]